MSEPHDEISTSLPLVRLEYRRIVLSDHAFQLLERVFPSPWMIRAIGAVAIWGFICLITQLGEQLYPVSCYSHEQCCQVNGAYEYASFALFSGFVIPLVGVLFQVLELLRSHGDVRLKSALLLYLLWAIFFVFLNTGASFLQDVDAGSWTPCLSGTLLGEFGAFSSLLLIVVLPFLFGLLGAFLGTRAIWSRERERDPYLPSSFSAHRVQVEFDQGRSRGGCLTLYLIGTVWACLAAILYTLSQLDSLLSYAPSYVFTSIGLALFQVACVYGIWNWKKWGVYGTVAAFGAGVIVAIGQKIPIRESLVISLIGITVLYLIIRSRWQYFDQTS